VSLPSLYIGTLVIYVVMMYISVYPVVITMRHSNVYEERSLGIYDEHRPGDETEDEDEGSEASLQNQATPVVSNGADIESGQPSLRRRRSATATAVATANAMHRTVKAVRSFHGVGASHPPHRAHHDDNRISFLRQQIHGQLAHDLWWLILATIIIVIIETDHFRKDPITYSTFNIVFEIVSAYGTVGISMGLPNQTYSFSGGWHAASKVVLCFVMLRGRHRGLPVALDRAVRLPGEHLARDEEEDHQIRKWKTVSRANLERLRSGFSAGITVPAER
jgi:Trk-type K+ transport system membrane component